MKLLIVEDHSDTRIVLARVLAECGFDLEAAANCAEAQRLAERLRWKIDIVIGDIVLPDGDGAELMQRFKARCGCYTLALTASCMASDFQRYTALGVDACLAKPADVDQILEALHTAINARLARALGGAGCGQAG